jgi:hypothetical protein
MSSKHPWTSCRIWLLCAPVALVAGPMAVFFLVKNPVGSAGSCIVQASHTFCPADCTSIGPFNSTSPFIAAGDIWRCGLYENVRDIGDENSGRTGRGQRGQRGRRRK